MIVIRTAEDLARVIDEPPDSELSTLLDVHRERLSEWQDYTLEELALFIIVQPGDRQDDIDAACDRPMLTEGNLTRPPELITDHPGWIEATAILSDDGFGLVLLVSKADGTPRDLLAACQRELARTGQQVNL